MVQKEVASNDSKPANNVQIQNIFYFGKKSLSKEIQVAEKWLGKSIKK
jgi:hypothetical protein